MTTIEWTDVTWNPVRGCSRVSLGCDSCYAMRFAHRFSGRGGRYEGLTRIGKRGVDWAGMARLVPDQLDAPLRWRKPRRVFVNSMSDLFHESLSDEDILAVFDVMRQCPQHTFQILTKRAERMRDVCSRMRFDGAGADGMGLMWLAPTGDANDGYRIMGGNGCTGMPWVWLGVSAEDQQRANERIPHLLATPAAVRFVSVEPMLGPVDLSVVPRTDDAYLRMKGERGVVRDDAEPDDYTYWLKRTALQWVICGSESGNGARPMQIAWAESLRDQCAAAGVAFFTKQIANAHDKKGGDPQHWPGGPWPREFPSMGERA